jgi:RNA polymerase sigma factor (sigma-70 family)
MTILEGEALLRHGQEIARRYARRVGSEEARDLGAEAVLHAVRRPAPDGRTAPWLERIARNLFIDGLRRTTPVPVAIEDACVPGSETPEDSTLVAERRRQVRQSLAALPADLRRAILSRFWGEMSDSEAARRLGVEPATVRTRIHRSLRRLRESLASLRAFVPPFFGKVGGMAFVPALVTALVVLPAVSHQSSPQRVAAATVPVQPQLPVAHQAAVEPIPAPEPPQAVRPRPRASHRPPAPTVAAKPQILAIEDAPQRDVVVLSPDTWLIVAVPAIESPSLVEVPVSFVTAFDKMIEDEL